MELSLRYFGDPILRQKAKPVEKITDEIRELCAQMLKFLEKTNVIGLAAPQVGYLHRIFVTNVEGENEQGELVLGGPWVYINPILTNPSPSLVEMNEGCLSIPGLSIPVVRPYSIDFEALDLEGNIFKEHLEGFKARNRMHENDHLNGVLTVDRLKGKARTRIDADLRRIKQRYYNA